MNPNTLDFEYPGYFDSLNTTLEYAVERGVVNVGAFSVGIDALLVFDWDLQTSELAENLRGFMNISLNECLEDIWDPPIYGD